jgi:hypothetical protein
MTLEQSLHLIHTPIMPESRQPRARLPLDYTTCATGINNYNLQKTTTAISLFIKNLLFTSFIFNLALPDKKRNVRFSDVLKSSSKEDEK